MNTRYLNFIIVIFCVLLFVSSCTIEPSQSQNTLKDTSKSSSNQELPEPSQTNTKLEVPQTTAQATSLPAEPSEEPTHEKTIRVYNIRGSKDSSGKQISEPDCQVPWYPYEFFEDPTAETWKSIIFNGGTVYTAKYRNSEIARATNYQTDYYHIGRIEFAVNHETGELTDLLAGEETGGNMTADDCSDKADHIAKQYLNIDEFEKTVTTDYFHTFEYIRYIDGIRTSERFHIAFTTAGDFIYCGYTMQGAFDEFITPENLENTLIAVNAMNHEDALTALENKLKSDYPNYASHIIDDQKLTVLDDGSLATFFGVTVNLDSDDPFYQGDVTEYIIKYE